MHGLPNGQSYRKKHSLLNKYNTNAYFDAVTNYLVCVTEF